MTDVLDGIAIRTAAASDAAALAELRSEWSGGTIDPGFVTRLADWYEQEREHRTTWLALAGDRPLGMVSVVEFRRMPKPGRPDARWGYVGQMFVRAEARNRGLGARLLSVLISAADERGYVRLVLSPSTRAVPFFRRAGFDVAGETSAALLLVRPGTAG